jgi:hypothetical protein
MRGSQPSPRKREGLLADEERRERLNEFQHEDKLIRHDVKVRGKTFTGERSYWLVGFG